VPDRGAVARGVLLLLIALAAYRPVFDAGFLHDDGELVARNPIVQRGGRGFGPEAWAGLHELWFPDPDSITPLHLPGIPVTATLFWLEWRMFGGGDDPQAAETGAIGAPGYHVVNVLLHALCALLLWRVLAQLAVPGAWFAALVFAVHPLCVESVAWIAEQKNTLSLAFALASMLAWLRWSDTRERAAWTASLAAFVLALLAKPAVAPLPLVLLLVAWWRRRPLGAELRAALPLFAAAFAAGLLAIYAQQTLAIADEQLAVGAPLERIASASFALGFYLWKTVHPFDLIAIYPRWHETLAWPVQIVPGVLFALVLAASWRARERWGRHVILGLGGFAFMLAPALGLVPMSYLRLTLVADHFAYAALPFPIALGVGAAAARLGALRTSTPPLVVGAAAALALVLAWQTASHSATFRDRRTLFTHTLERNPDAWLAHDQLAALLLADHAPAFALVHLERAVALAPHNGQLHNNLAVALDQLGRREQALEHIQKAAELRPNDDFVQLNTATGLLGAGRPREALPHFAAALALAARRSTAEDPTIRIYYGAALLQAGRPREAIDQLERALALDPERPGARQLLAEAQRQLVEAPSEARPAR
jgi:protein O-mannosyl-transferase